MSNSSVMNDHIMDFYLTQKEPVKSCLMTIRDLILIFNTNISETTKYGMPCFVFASKALCYLWIDKKKNLPYILFVDGSSIKHPLLKQGDRKRMKVLFLDPASDLPVETINEILAMAIAIRL